MSPHLAASVLPPHLHSAFVPRLWEFSLPHLPVLVVLFRLHAPLHFVVPLPLPQLVPPFVHLGYLHLAQQRLQLVASRDSVRAWQEATHAQIPLPCISSSQWCYVWASTPYGTFICPSDYSLDGEYMSLRINTETTFQPFVYGTKTPISGFINPARTALKS